MYIYLSVTNYNPTQHYFTVFSDLNLIHYVFFLPRVAPEFTTMSWRSEATSDFNCSTSSCIAIITVSICDWLVQVCNGLLKGHTIANRCATASGSGFKIAKSESAGGGPFAGSSDPI
jgi:hypothetical protein